MKILIFISSSFFINPWSKRNDIISSCMSWNLIWRCFSHGRSFAVKDEIFCLFEGALDNLVSLRQQYGLAKSANEVVLVIEAYKALRDRAPYPPNHVVGHFSGDFAFMVFDKSTSTLFVASVRGITLIHLGVFVWSQHLRPNQRTHQDFPIHFPSSITGPAWESSSVLGDHLGWARCLCRWCRSAKRGLRKVAGLLPSRYSLN